MTENKRFKIVDEQFISYYGGTGHKISNEECGFWLWHNKIESQKVCDKLNGILDENEQLQKKNDNLVNMIERVQCRADTIKEKNKQLEKYFDIPIDDGKSMSIKELLEEYNKLKAQLYCDDDEGVCIICKYHYLEKGNVFYISKCEKGHEECSKEDLRHCKDFEVKELQE